MNSYIYVPLAWNFSKENNLAFKQLCIKFVQTLIDSKNRKADFQAFITQTDNFILMNPLKSATDRDAFAELYWGFLTNVGRGCDIFNKDIEKAFKAAKTKSVLLNVSDSKIN